MYYIFEANLKQDREQVLKQIEQWLIDKAIISSFADEINFMQVYIDKDEDGTIMECTPDDAPFCLNYGGEPEGYYEWSCNAALEISNQDQYDSVIVVEFDPEYYDFAVVYEVKCELR